MQEVVRELQDFGYITDVEILDPTWIEVAYTWSWPHSKWKGMALRKLQEHGIFQVGRYGRWIFQGIADSLRDGFVVGSSLQVTIYNFSKGARRSLKEKLWIYVTIFTLADVTRLFKARLVTQIQIRRELFQDPFALPPSNHR